MATTSVDRTFVDTNVLMKLSNRTVIAATAAAIHFYICGGFFGGNLAPQVLSDEATES